MENEKPTYEGNIRQEF